uniref:Uncharacterized protein n=1 Tax=Ananas comosus var. bracteatus TaxID=296719 RepID=A0A6V7PLN8_ANACO|nr:unnamed protein product [Ananas comosus var. bracteatus]
MWSQWLLVLVGCCIPYLLIWLVGLVLRISDLAGRLDSVDLGSRQHIDSLVMCFDLVDRGSALYALVSGFGLGTGFSRFFYSSPSSACGTHWEGRHVYMFSPPHYFLGIAGGEG